MPTSYQATALLAVSVIGAALSILWQAHGGGFWAGLLAHGCTAASIGGLADWFAVTAIFRRPLGIGWRTDILRRHRGRITKDLVAFASEDLLSRENIMQTLAKEDFAQMLVTYLTKRGGTERLTALAEAALRQTVEDADTDIDGLCADLTPPIQEILGRIDVSALIGEGAEALCQSAEPERMVRAFLPSLRQLIGEPVVQERLLSHVTAMREAYEGDSIGRSALFTLLGLSDEKLLSLCNEKIAEALSKLERGEGEMWEATQAFLHRVLVQGRENQALRRWIEAWKAEEVRRLDLTDAARRYWDAHREEKIASWILTTRTMIEDCVQRFAQEKAWQESVNQSLLRFFSHMVEEYHDEIPRLIEAQVGRLSDDDLVALAESKVADDLQMVRVNGSVVGAVTGMALYLLLTATGRFWG